MTFNDTYTLAQTKNNNRATILRLICTGAADSRAALTRITGLSKMAVSNIVVELISEGLICETDKTADTTTSGRRPVAIELSPEAPLVVGIFISRSVCELVVTSMSCAIINYVKIDLPEAIADMPLTEALYDAYQELIRDIESKIIGIGIASIGPIDKKTGTILNPPDFYGLENICIQEFFEKKTGLRVFFDNNMDAAVLAEKIFGHGKNLTNLIYLGVLRGIGAGVISNGNLLQGSTGIHGEIGHTSIKFDGPVCQCGNRGCLELYASIPVIVDKVAQEMRDANTAPSGDFDWAKLVEMARSGDYYCNRALGRLCEFLSIGIVNLVNLFDCDEVVLGHDIALAKGLIEARLEQEINSRIFASKIKKVKVRMSYFEHHAPLFGAACLVLSNVFNITD